MQTFEVSPSAAERRGCQSQTNRMNCREHLQAPGSASDAKTEDGLQQPQLEPATGKGDRGNLEEPPEKLIAVVWTTKPEKRNALKPCHLTVTKEECGCAKPEGAVGQERENW